MRAYSEVIATLVVPLSLVTLARALAGGLSERGKGMFTTPLSVSGGDPVTHYMSSGFMDSNIYELLMDISALHMACVMAGANVTIEQCTTLVNSSDVSLETPESVLSRLNLKYAVPS